MIDEVSEKVSSLEETDSEMNENSESESDIKYTPRPTFKERIQLIAGQSFGDLAMIKQQPRSATVVWLEDCWFITITKEMFDKVILKVETAKKSRVVDFLQTTKLCGKLPKSILNRMYYGIEYLEYSHGQTVIGKSLFL